MGWTYSHKPKWQTVQSFLEERFNCVNESGSWKILKCKSSIREAYIALEVIHTGQPRRVVGVVCLLGYDKKSHYNFGYKDMDEGMGPYSYNCPAEILDMLTPTDNEYALKWREKCRETLRKNKSVTPNALRACLPASPNTSNNNSEQPLVTKWCSVNDSVELTKLITFTTRLTRSKFPK